MLTFLVGGARSGKSTLAVRMGERQAAPVTFVATAEPFDDDLRERVRRHRDERPASWSTVESPLQLADAMRSLPADHFVIVDCLTVWIANAQFHERDVAAMTDEFVDALAGRAGAARHAGTVVVSNEVGLGVHPDTDLGRIYRDQLGRLNQRVASVADTSLFMVAGRAIPLHDPWEFLT